MLAAVKTETIREIILENRDIPSLAHGEVLINVDYCGICGSDLHAFNHSKGYEFVNKPIILGHEISGKVVECNDPESEYLIGKKVIVESMHYCGHCENCKNSRYSICESNKCIGLHFDGGMAEFVKTKSKYVREIPDGLPLSIAALSEPLSIAIHAVNRAGEINQGQTVLVQGPGIIGFFVALVCVEKNAKVILSGLERDYENRLSKCLDFGITPHIADKSSLSEKVDIVFECSGSNVAVKNGFNNLKKGGRAVFVALYEQDTNLFLTQLVRNEWPIITSYGCGPVDYVSAFNILQKYQNKLNNVVGFYPLSKVNQAFDNSLNQDVLKAVLSME
ncbi:alcohol dehydrogenase catalytic domain-containing protein [Alicyclobacillus fastidiosus]|uniref:Alcohol dehydrogenase catalytic domain-containing protein n=1 Tax=Alicyclobacillus fastidiosus TaxID=392011 RepID=A0ABY6ZG11_9BACL|nr:alcohol dehydrogenase catalytic domain-containing protein [Alicyclobacillus fastidiosus]WAH41799.1 alcohol dehydrogenase catalytic domain-containing protein [Alicyclobacillus fastidiosus]GMA63496.1 alcohol dehydrogenase catalytic domain-containing protein [Alicyclobacillus fastidiosus]